MERALAFVKTEHLDRWCEIFGFFDERLWQEFGNFERGLPSVFLLPPARLIAEHYAHIKGVAPKVYEDVINVFSKGGIVVREYRGRDGMILAARGVLGNTDPQKAEMGTVRRVYSTDSLAVALAEGRAVRNVMHVSGSPEEGIAELERFRKFVFSGDKTLYVSYCLR
jgi:nucleoside diphosphate kinase